MTISYTIKQCHGCLCGLLLLWSVYAPVPAAGEELRGEQRLDLPSLVREALENNPDIQAAQHRWAATKTLIPQVQTLPDPMLNFGI
jgi:outer membrane protein TolC